MNLTKIRSITARVRERYSGLAEATLADMAAGHFDQAKKQAAALGAHAKAKKTPKPAAKAASKKQKTRLEFVGSNWKNQSGHSSKFYEVTVDGTKVTIRYGKLGSHGQSKTTDQGGEYSAKAFASSQIAKKKKKGYKEV